MQKITDLPFTKVTNKQHMKLYQVNHDIDGENQTNKNISLTCILVLFIHLSRLKINCITFYFNLYYSESLFFLSIAIHRVMPETLHKIIMMDADLKFNNDIKELFKLFDEFSTTNVIGIARENQPVYRHVLSNYRRANPDTHVGDPPPNGITGFNSGVLLLNLDKMRKSDVYNSLIKPKVVKDLTEKFTFKGHLGDQDFFSLLSMEHKEYYFSQSNLGISVLQFPW
jgi:lipopolysaccharide biosynthesis glycosyltransferase